MKILDLLRSTILVMSSCLCALSIGAQTRPNKPVSLIVPYPAGGSGDFTARLIQHGYQKELGQPVIVENHPGAGGAIAAQKVLSASRDSFMQLMGGPMDLILGPLALSAVKHKPEDFRLAGLVATSPVVLLIRADIPANNLEEFITWAKGRDTVTYGSTGYGSLFHLLGAKFAASTGLKMVNVPYKGGTQFFSDIISGQVDMAFWTLAGPTLGFVKGGRLRALGIAALRADPELPDVPPLNTNKALKDFNFSLWMGTLVPKSTPEPIVATIHKAIAEVTVLPNVQKGFVDSGAQVFKPMSQGEIDKFYADEIFRYREMAKSINLRPQ